MANSLSKDILIQAPDPKGAVATHLEFRPGHT
jgi:hypothetical protein